MEFIEENLLPCPCYDSKVKYFPMSHRINNMYNKNTIIYAHGRNDQKRNLSRA